MFQIDIDKQIISLLSLHQMITYKIIKQNEIERRREISKTFTSMRLAIQVDIDFYFLFSKMLYDVLYDLVFTTLKFAVVIEIFRFCRYSPKSPLLVQSCMTWLSILCGILIFSAVTSFFMLVVKLMPFPVICLYYLL